jgi:hypothetical protein
MKRCKINIILSNKKTIVLDSILEAQYKPDFWSPKVIVKKIKYNNIWYSLNAFKQALYDDKKIVFDILKIDVVL